MFSRNIPFALPAIAFRLSTDDGENGYDNFRGTSQTIVALNTVYHVSAGRILRAVRVTGRFTLPNDEKSGDGGGRSSAAKLTDADPEVPRNRSLSRDILYELLSGFRRSGRRS